MGAANFDDVCPVARLGFKRRLQLHQRGQQFLPHGRGGGNVQRGWKGIVGRLAFIDMIIGVDRVCPATLARQHLIGAPGNDFIDVHIGLGA